MKKFIAALLSSVVLLTAAMPYNVFAEDYLTRGEVSSIILKAADDYNADVELSDILRGDNNGNLYEDREATKLETFIMIDRAFGKYPELKGNNLIMNISDADYKDIPQWAEADMEEALKAGIADGIDPNTFDSNAKVTKTDLEKYLKRVYAVFGSNLKDDYYSTVNKDVLDNVTIAAGRASGGTMYEVLDKNEEQIGAIVSECVNGQFEKGSKEDKIKNYYNNYVDIESRNSMDISIIQEYIDDIDNMKTIEDFQKLNEKLYNDLGIYFINFDITIDDKDSDSFILYLDYPSAALSKDVYEGENENLKTAYFKYIKRILTLSGYSDEQAEDSIEKLYKTHEEIAKKSLSVADMQDIEKTYNIYTVEELDEIFSELDIQAIYEMSGFQHLNKICINQPDEMKEVADLFTNKRIDELKNQCRVDLIVSVAAFLGQDYIDASNLFERETMGISESDSLEKKAVSSVVSIFSSYIGEMYGDKYCTDEMVNNITAMAEEIVDVYRERIDNLDWMSAETKKNAKLKLDKMTINIGEPSKYDDIFVNADIKSKEDGGSYFLNTVEIVKANKRNEIEVSKNPIDKTEWPMSPQTVNACYSFSHNGIFVPIAFLQEPIYSANYSYEENLGKIGSVIGHEISHAFDSMGSQYDEKGNAANWWTDEDKAKFNELCQEVIDFYNDDEWCPGIDVDGELTLTENISDLGGLAVTLSVAETKENFDYDKFFRAYSDYYARTNTRERSQYLSLTDVHSPHSIRVNNTVKCTDEFYETYGINENDGMYVAKEDRVGIW